MRILTVNAGSSSLRLALFEGDEHGLERLAKKRYRIEHGEYAERVGDFLDELDDRNVDAVAHRIVHGGKLTAPALIDKQVETTLEEAAVLAPLHNPPALACLRAVREALDGTLPHLAVFDTGFFSDLPGAAATYALPGALRERYNIRRYGFHGLAHQAMWQRWLESHPHGGRVITFQLGAGCSATAIHDGRPLDTSMGMSPLEGLVMASRCGDLDPGVATLLQRSAGFSADETEEILYRHSGLLGLSGKSSRMSELVQSDNAEARLAVDVFVHRARKYLGAYLVVLGGADGIIFGGGIGEHAPKVRERILADMAWAGIAVDTAVNDQTIGRDGVISSPDSTAEVRVAMVDEEGILAQEAARRLGSTEFQ